jgi:hypothetical protein
MLAQRRAASVLAHCVSGTVGWRERPTDCRISSIAALRLPGPCRVAALSAAQSSSCHRDNGINDGPRAGDDDEPAADQSLGVGVSAAAAGRFPSSEKQDAE